MKFNKGQFARQHTNETDVIRELAESPDYSAPEAGFCEVSGKWTTRLIQVGDKKVCKTVAQRIAQVTPEDGLDDEMDREQEDHDDREEAEKTTKNPPLKSEG